MEQQHPSINKNMSELGGNLRDNIPHVIIGDKNKPREPDDPLVAKVKKWTLIVLTVLVLGSAVILIVGKLISRFF